MQNKIKHAIENQISIWIVLDKLKIVQSANIIMIQNKKYIRELKHITNPWMVSPAFQSTLDLVNSVWDESICLFDQLHRKSCIWKHVPHHLKIDSHHWSIFEPIIHLLTSIISCQKIAITIGRYCYSIWEESHPRRVSPINHFIHFLRTNCSINQNWSTFIRARILQNHSTSTRFIPLRTCSNQNNNIIIYKST